jgi:phage recombination protein Bet
VAKSKGEVVAVQGPAQQPQQVQAAQPGGLTDAQVDLLKRSICKGATDDELMLFLQQCNRTQLDPFSKQIHGVKRWDAKERREVLSIQVGIDGFRLVAQRTGDLDGQEGPFWCGEDGTWRDVWLHDAPPRAAKVVVWRKGCSRPFVGIAHWSEYKQEYKDRDSGQMRLTPFWLRMPAGQLAKCAEGLALRKAFPQELSGLYAPEEMRDDGQGEAAQEEPSGQKPPPRQVEALPAPAEQRAGKAEQASRVVMAKHVQEIAEASTPESLKTAGERVDANKAVLLPDHLDTLKRAYKDRRAALMAAAMQGMPAGKVRQRGQDDGDPADDEERAAIQAEGRGTLPGVGANGGPYAHGR